MNVVNTAQNLPQRNVVPSSFKAAITGSMKNGPNLNENNKEFIITSFFTIEQLRIPSFIKQV